MIEKHFAWLPKLLARLKKSGVEVFDLKTGTGDEAIRAIMVSADHWGRIATYLSQRQCRLAGLWGEDRGEVLRVTACVEKGGAYLLVKAEVPRHTPEIDTWSNLYPAANRLERHARDMLGLEFKSSADPRRWTRHQAWPKRYFPLRQEASLAGHPPKQTPADAQYPFHRVEGEAVYEIPVGPVHAGIIEPGHFRFHAIGETVLNLEARLGYVHKGIEKLAEGRDAAGLARLAGRVSGDSTVAHAWAAMQAAERAVHLEVPERALYLRAVLCERERIANHLGDIGAICNDVGFVFAQIQFSRLRELWLRRNRELFGHRLMMDCIVPGGVRHDVSGDAAKTLLADVHSLRTEFTELLKILRNTHSLRDRLIATGVLHYEDAQRLGCLGYVGRASGLNYDARLDSPYPPYDQLNVERVLHKEGDVAARLFQRAQEVYASMNLLRQALDKLPHGPLTVAWQPPSPDVAGIGIVEGWRGEILTFVRFNAEGRVARYFPRDPSWFNWPALEILIHGNIVPDFPVCNKSVNGSYSGCDL